jgi:type VI secretion system ImpA family protein
MPSPPLLDFERLLAPIDREQPSGALLRYTEDEDYRTLKEAYRRKYQPSMTVTQEDTETVSWPTVIEHAGRILATKSKDLEAATWLVEALTVHHGLPGLRDGLRLLGALLQGYWADLHPHAEDEATTIEARANYLAGLHDDISPCLQALERQPASVPATAAGDLLYEDLDQCLDALQRLKQVVATLFESSRPCLQGIEDALQDYAIWMQTVRRNQHC